VRRAGDFSFNSNQPYSFVGEDLASWRAYKVEVAEIGQATAQALAVDAAQ